MLQEICIMCKPVGYFLTPVLSGSSNKGRCETSLSVVMNENIHGLRP